MKFFLDSLFSIAAILSILYLHCFHCGYRDVSFQYLEVSILFVSSTLHERDHEKLEMLQVSIRELILPSSMRQCVFAVERGLMSDRAKNQRLLFGRRYLNFVKLGKYLHCGLWLTIQICWEHLRGLGQFFKQWEKQGFNTSRRSFGSVLYCFCFSLRKLVSLAGGKGRYCETAHTCTCDFDPS